MADIVFQNPVYIKCLLYAKHIARTVHYSQRICQGVIQDKGLWEHIGRKPKSAWVHQGRLPKGRKTWDLGDEGYK